MLLVLEELRLCIKLACPLDAFPRITFYDVGSLVFFFQDIESLHGLVVKERYGIPGVQ